MMPARSMVCIVLPGPFSRSEFKESSSITAAEKFLPLTFVGQTISEFGVGFRPADGQSNRRGIPVIALSRRFNSGWFQPPMLGAGRSDREARRDQRSSSYPSRPATPRTTEDRAKSMAIRITGASDDAHPAMVLHSDPGDADSQK